MTEPTDVGEITQLLVAAGRGEEGALDDAFTSVYPRLRQLARSRRREWQGNPTLNTTSLIHEAYLKVASARGGQYESRGHFFAVAAQAMRQVLINYAEKRSAKKRGSGAAHVELHEADAVTNQAFDEILALEDALRGLEKMSPRQAKVVECLFFAGFTIEETGEALGLSPATVKRDWSSARAWLYRAMNPDTPAPR